jgi:hypothetical protein
MKNLPKLLPIFKEYGDTSIAFEKLEEDLHLDYAFLIADYNSFYNILYESMDDTLANLFNKKIDEMIGDVETLGDLIKMPKTEEVEAAVKKEVSTWDDDIYKTLAHDILNKTNRAYFLGRDKYLDYLNTMSNEELELINGPEEILMETLPTIAQIFGFSDGPATELDHLLLDVLEVFYVDDPNKYQRWSSDRIDEFEESLIKKLKAIKDYVEPINIIEPNE